MVYLCLLSLVIVIPLYFIYKRTTRTTIKHKKTVFVTGCDSGIGYKLAAHLDRLGCIVYAGCLFAEGDGASKLKGESSDRLKIVPLDITNEDCVANALKFVKEDLKGRADLWAIVNNAGVCVCGEFDWLTMKQCMDQVNVNLCGTINVTKAFLSLIRRSKGRIVNVTSVSGRCTYPGVSVYCATKFALEGFSDCLRLELAKYGVEVVVIQPGDFSRLTRLMSNHKMHVKEMWDQMDEEKRKFYGTYFNIYHDKVLQNYEVPTTETLESTPLLKNIEEALFSSSPSVRYTVVTLPFRIFFLLLRFLPTGCKDRVTLFVMKVAFGSDFDQKSFND